MRILAVSHEFPPIGGGGANACYFLTKGFVEEGHEVTLVTANFENLPQEEIINGVKVYRVNALRTHKEHCSFKEMLSYLFSALPVAKQLQKKEKFDICLVFFGIPSGPIGYVLKIKYGLPYIIRFGGGDVPGFQERFTKVYKLIAPAIRRIWDKADARIANSEGLKEMALDFYDKNEFDIICNGVDSTLFSQNGDYKNDKFRILFVSRLIERKGLQYIIPKLGKISDVTGRQIELVIVGDGPYRSRLEELAEQHHVSEVVRFEGQKDKDEIVPFYQKADLFILPSEKEGMPNVVLEAMACGLPIVMTPCEGSKELIDGNGFVTDIQNFIDPIINLINDETLRAQCAKRSRQLVQERFTWNVTVDQYLQKMDQIVAKK